MEAVTASLVAWGAAGLALEGQSASGDRYVVKPFIGGALAAVVDGLGHGEEAAAAADSAIRTLEDHAGESVIALVKRCHEALRGTRGAVMSLASFNACDSTVTWLGVGNVDGRLLRRGGGRHENKESLLLRAGVVGVKLPPLAAAVLPVAAGDAVILASDGIRGEFDRAAVPTGSPQRVADRILAEHGSAADDALVLVLRYLGAEASLR